MDSTKLIWMNGSLVPWDDAKVHVLVHGLHYGSAVFEGVRCYEQPDGKVGIFRLDEHTDRLLYSANALGMEVPFSKEELNQAQIETVRENQLNGGYVRPLIYYGYGKMGLNPVGAPVDVSIACWPWGAYLGGDTVDIKISDYIRIHPKTSVTDAKISGHYVNSIMASLEVHEDDRYHEALFLDYEGNVAEGPGENLFLVKDGKLHTPQLGTILGGITRASLIQIAADEGYETVERVIAPDELWDSEEAFFTGTAAEVCGITSVDQKPIGSGEMGPVTAKLREIYANAVRGGDERYKKWVTVV